MITTRHGTRIDHLQLCSADPTDLEGVKAALGSVATLTGVHQRITVRAYGISRRASIRTLLVRTDPDGHIEILAKGGTYRYLIVGGGTAELHITSTAGTLVDIVEASDVTITTTDVSVDITARSGTTTINTVREARGRIEITRDASCSVTGAGPEMNVIRSARRHVVVLSPRLSAELIARIPANPFRLPAAHIAED